MDGIAARARPTPAAAAVTAGRRGLLFPVVALLSLQLANTAASLAADPEAGKATYENACASCHDAGKDNAPRLNDASAWKTRLAQPRAVLDEHAVDGYKDMPAKGGKWWLFRSNVVAAVDYMLTQIPQPKSAAKSEIAPRYHVPPKESEIPGDKYGDDVRLGLRIFTETPKYARRYVGNQLTCANCHLDAGRRPHAAPLWAAYGMYPAYKAKSDRNDTFEERIQQCFRFSMNGISPALDTPEMRALVSYAHFLARGAPTGVDLPGRGYPDVARTSRDPSPTRGAAAYKTKCAACHGGDGEGQKKEDGTYANPPLWGFDSYNKGAGLAQNALLAGFIKANMALGRGGSLSDQEVVDLAAFINLQLRPGDPRKGILRGMFD